MKNVMGSVMTVVVLLLMSGCLAGMGHSAAPHYAWVTNEQDNNLLVVNLYTEKIVKSIATGKKPHALIFSPNGKGYINNRGERSLTVVDTESMAVLKTIKLPATSIQFALSPDGNTLAVGYKDALKISLIDTASAKIITTIDIGKNRPDKKIVRIKHPYWSKDGRFVYAGDNLNNTVVKIDAAAKKIVKTFHLAATTHHFSTAPNGQIYVSHGHGTDGRLKITVLNKADQVVKTIDIPMAKSEKAKGHHGAFTPDGSFFYFCNEGGRTLAIIDTTSLNVVKTLQVGKGAGHTYFSRDGKRAFIVCHHDNVVTVIDTVRQEIIKNIQVGSGKKEGHSGYISQDGSFYMLNAADGMINKIDGEKLTLKSQIKVGRNPMIMVVR